MIVVQEFGKLSHSRSIHAFGYLQVSWVVIVEILLQSSGRFPLPFADFALVSPELAGKTNLKTADAAFYNFLPLRGFYEATFEWLLLFRLPS